MSDQIICPHCGSDDVFPRGNICMCGGCGQKFELFEEEKPVQPMKLFLSYGHPEAVICKRIEQALQERGHSVWFDAEQITHGSDWRERITKGIRDSNGVISCLSKHSVRSPGVCQDELSIAIGIRGGNIKTILLEPEEEVKAPASVCHLQWLDMSDWKNRYEQGEAVFRPWFDQKMSQLFKVIESDDSRDFVGQIQTIRDKLSINYNTSKQNDLLKRLYVGREWLTEQLEAWLDDEKGAQLCVLYGDPGVGKSAFAAHYIHYNPRVAAGLFCVYDTPHYNDARAVAKTLAYLLACRLPAYRVVLADILERKKGLDSLTAPELFELLLSGPLSNLVIDGKHETLCIVIDGLDECSQGEYNALAETLANYVPLLPKWLRVLVTSREVSAVKGPMQGVYQLGLYGSQAQNQEDIRSYFKKCLEDKYGPDSQDKLNHALDKLAKQSGGIFLYAQLVTEGILAGKMSIEDTEQFPDGLSGAFYRWFGWFFPDDGEYKARFRLPLGMLLAAPEPLPTEELKRIFQWGDNELEDFLRPIEVLVRRGMSVFRKETVTFSHLYIAEWLDSRGAGRFRSQKSDALAKMAERFHELFRQGAKKLTEFEALHLAALLKACDNAPALEDVMMSTPLCWQIRYAGEFCAACGKPDEAERCYRQAQTMVKWMTARRDDADDKMMLCALYQSIADLLNNKGDLDGAKEYYEKCLSVAKQLEMERGLPNDRQNLSAVYTKMAAFLSSHSDWDGAEKYSEAGLAVQEQLVKEYSTLSTRSRLAACYSVKADILKAKGDLEGAKRYYYASLPIREQAVQERSTANDFHDLENSYTNILNLRNLRIGYTATAGLLKAQNDLDGAKELYEKSIPVQEQLVQKCGAQSDRHRLSATYVEIADILKAQNDLDSAKEIYEKALAITEKLAQERNTPEDRRQLCVIYIGIANILESQNNLDGVKEIYEKCIAVEEQLVRESGEADDRYNLILCYGKTADILRAKGDLNGAKELIKMNITMAEELVQERGTRIDCQALSISYERMADILKAEGNLDIAKGLYEKSIDIRTRLVKEYNVPDDRYDLSNSYLNMADILKAQNNLEGAKAFYEKNLAIREPLARERGTLKDYLGLAFSYDSLAALLGEEGSPDGARKFYEKCLTIYEQLARERGSISDYDSLSATLWNLALVIQDRDLKTAIDYTDRSLDILKKLCDSTKKRSYFERFSWSRGLLLELYQKLLGRTEQLVKERGASEDHQTLGSCYVHIGALLKAKGDLNGAKEFYERGLAFTQQLMRDRGYADDYFAFAMICWYLADTLEKQDREAALGYANSGLGVMEMLYKATNNNFYQERSQVFRNFINRPVE